MEVSKIAKEVDISEKTTTRRLDRMKEGRLLDFTIQCNPAAMIGYIQYAIPITMNNPIIAVYLNGCTQNFKQISYTVLV